MGRIPGGPRTSWSRPQSRAGSCSSMGSGARVPVGARGRRPGEADAQRLTGRRGRRPGRTGTRPDGLRPARAPQSHSCRRNAANEAAGARCPPHSGLRSSLGAPTTVPRGATSPTPAPRVTACRPRRGVSVADGAPLIEKSPECDSGARAKPIWSRGMAPSHAGHGPRPPACHARPVRRARLLRGGCGPGLARRLRGGRSSADYLLVRDAEG